MTEQNSLQRIHPVIWLVVLGVIALAVVKAYQGSGSDPHSAGADATALAPQKSPNDQRAYRYLELPNKMRVLLVSDPETDKSAAAVSVYRGSFDEPENRPGIAHFLEHMLFIGTGKYPEISSFQNFITGNGGSSNAYTALDHTNYFFDIQNSGFAEGLDRFAHFFIDPLLDEAYVAREKNAVHSEYQMQIKDDGWRGYMVSKQAMNPAHPGSRFTIGSLDTLNGDVGADLKTFFAAHYSADQMGAVILGTETLDELEARVAPLLGQVANNDLGPTAPDVPLFTAAQLPAQLASVSLKNTVKIAYNFPMPNTLPVYRNKPERYITNLLGHEGSGSLHSELTARGWIESLSAGTDQFDQATAVLSINMELTDAGRQNIPQISDLVFQYIDLVKASPPSEWLYEEQAKVAELGFRFQEKGSTVGFVYQMAPRLNDYPPEDLLVAPYLMQGFDADLIRDYLKYLRPDNVFLEIAAPDVATNAVEPWFEVAYALTPGDLPRIAVADAAFELPEPNPYLPDELDLLDADSAAIELAVDSPELQIWLDSDVEFGTPRANMSLQILLPGGLVNAEDQVYAKMFTAMITDGLSETAYPAYLAGLSYSLGSFDGGLSLSIGGYNDKQMVLLRTLLDAMQNSVFDEARFTAIKEGLIKDWRNTLKDKPYIQTLNALNESMLSSRWPGSRLAEIGSSISIADLADWRERRLASMRVVGGLHGNVGIEAASQLAAQLRAALPLDTTIRTRGATLELGENLLVDLNVDHNDSAILIYVQDSDDSYRSRAQSTLAGQLLRSPYFADLRTDQQLGYVVSAGVRVIDRRGGNIFLVQSPSAGAGDLEQATLAFMQSYVDEWKDLSDEAFAQQKAGVITRLTEKDKNLSQRSTRYWQDLGNEVFTFDSKQQIAAEVEKLSKNDMGEFMQNILSALQERRLMIYSQGKFADVPALGRPLVTQAAAP